MSPRKTLDILTEERFIRVGSTKSSYAFGKQERQNNYFLQTDWEMVFVIFERLSGTARRIAELMMKDVNHFSNIFSGTQIEIQEALQLSDKPVKEAMIELQQTDFIRKYKHGRYMINPRVAIGCSKEYLPKLLDDFQALPPYMPKRKGVKQNVD